MKSLNFNRVQDNFRVTTINSKRNGLSGMGNKTLWVILIILSTPLISRGLQSLDTADLLYQKAKKCMEDVGRGKEEDKANYYQAIELYKKITREYPDSKWAPYAQFLLGYYYGKLVNSTLSDFTNEEARDKAIAAYREVINRYPDATFPESVNPYLFKKGMKIAPVAQLLIARLYH
jgi:outer membrane protein assembly factor BamD (BamD/ComL family)